MNGQRLSFRALKLDLSLVFWVAHRLTLPFFFPRSFWQGTPFADICELTDVPEGLIVRTIVRLDETCREFKNAAAIMGNSALYKKMEIASNAIKRDIVFAASLYITGV